MSLRAGIIGLPNVGKSTLFNAITKASVVADNYPFATIQPNIGVVELSDQRVKALTEIFKPAKIVPASFQFVDIAGLVRGASKGQGLGNKFLSHIREVDALCQVVRCFPDKAVVHVEGSVDPIRDSQIIDLELIFADQDTITNRLHKIEKTAKANTKAKNLKVEVDLLKKLLHHLGSDLPIRTLDLHEDEQKLIQPYNLLTAKPMIYVINVNEGQLKDLETDALVLKFKDYANKQGIPTIVLSAKFENDLLDLSAEEQEIFLSENNIKESGLNQLSRAAYDLLGLATFFTAGPKEVHAWTFKKGMTAVECAGIVHSDIARGFIVAEIYQVSDLIKLKSLKEIQTHGYLRKEGRDYLVKDGDVCYFRFNV